MYFSQKYSYRVKKNRALYCSTSAEEREELEVLNNIRQKQLELKHHQLLQELESLKNARETQNFSTSSLPMNSSTTDANFKHLM